MAEEAAEAASTPGPRRRRRSRRIWIIVLVAIAVLVVWLVVARSHRRKKPPPAMPTVTVTAEPAQRGNLDVHLETIGTVTSLNTVSIASQVTGVIEAVRYREGQLVKRGEPLITIDARPFEAALRQVQGTLKRDKEVLAQARMNLVRYRAAWAQNAIARQVYEDQEMTVRQAEGTVLADRAAVENARVQLAYTSITAPITGRTGLRLVDPGNLVTATSQTPLVVITQIAPISVVFPISEDDLGSVWNQPGRGEGLAVSVFDRTRTNKLADGTLHTIDNQVDTTTGTVRVRALFDNADANLFPNQFVNTRVLVRTLQNVVTVPTSAIQRSAQNTFVYAIDTGRAHVVKVKVGATDGDRTQVDGLAAGTHVATSSFEKLREGVPVVTPDQVRQARPMGGPTR